MCKNSMPSMEPQWLLDELGWLTNREACTKLCLSTYRWHHPHSLFWDWTAYLYTTFLYLTAEIKNSCLPLEKIILSKIIHTPFITISEDHKCEPAYRQDLCNMVSRKQEFVPPIQLQKGPLNLNQLLSSNLQKIL